MCLYDDGMVSYLKVTLSDLEAALRRLRYASEETQCWRLWALHDELDRLIQELVVAIFIPAPDVDPEPELPEELEDDGGL